MTVSDLLVLENHSNSKITFILIEVLKEEISNPKFDYLYSLPGTMKYHHFASDTNECNEVICKEFAGSNRTLKKKIRYNMRAESKAIQVVSDEFNTDIDSNSDPDDDVDI